MPRLPCFIIHHYDARAGQDQHHDARDVETTRVIAAGANDVDRARRPALDPGIDRALPKRARELRHLARSLSFFCERRQKFTLRFVRFTGRGESGRGDLDLCRRQIATGGEGGGELGKL
jgi:hypothetical protein